jgi:BlaI family penicillinase repressor
MSNTTQISDSEWLVMKAIWSNGSCTANEIVKELEDKTHWQPKTIKTLINRLVKKNAIGYEIDKQDKKTYHYYPLIQEQGCIREESKTFLNRVFNGSLNAMLANFLNEAELSDEEIDELKRILDKRKG